MPAASITAWKIKPLHPDGSNQNFLLQYVNAATVITDAAVGKSEELLVTLDGTPQEPGIDFTATGNQLHLAVAPGADADLWAVWMQPVVP